MWLKRLSVLLLTATVKPNANQPNLKMTNPQERLEDYKRAMVFYDDALKKGVIDGIVFVDNSGFDLKILSSDFPSKNIEWISFYGLDYPSSYHRGYGEFKLIDYAFANSTTLKKLNESDKVWKVTGRYIIKNLRRVILYAPRKFELYCDIKNNWLDMALISWNIRGYEHSIKGVCEQFKTGMAPELIMSNLILGQAKLGDGIVSRYHWLPLISGRRGGDGSQFQGKYTSIKYFLLSCVNWLILPFRNSQ